MQYVLNPFKSIKLIFKLGLQRYLLFSFLLTVLLSVLISFGVFLFMNYVVKKILLNYIPDIQYLSNIFSLIITILILSQSFLLFVVFYRIIAQISFLPFLNKIREKLEFHFNLKETYTTHITYDIKNILWGIFKSLYYLLIYILIFLITFLLGPIQNMILFLFDSYLLGNGIYDIYLERKFPDPKKRSIELKKRRKEIFLTGLASIFLLLIPIIGILLSFICGYISAFINENKIKNF